MGFLAFVNKVIVLCSCVFTDFLRRLGVLVAADRRAAGFVLQSTLVSQLDQQIHEVVPGRAVIFPLADHLRHDVLEEFGDAWIDDLDTQQLVQLRRGRSQHPPERGLITRLREPLRRLVEGGFLVGERVYLYAEGAAADDVDDELRGQLPHLDCLVVVTTRHVDEPLQLLAALHQQVEHPLQLARRERGRQFRPEALPLAPFEIEQVSGERILTRAPLE